MDFVIAAYAYENGFLSVKLQDVAGQGFQELAKRGYRKEISAQVFLIDIGTDKDIDISQHAKHH